MKAIGDLVKFTEENNIPMGEAIQVYQFETKKLYQRAYKKDDFPYLDDCDNKAFEIVKRYYQIKARENNGN